MSLENRPLFHFAPEHGWINDPNGLVRWGDEWHLGYQYFDPTDIDGMQWGHAVSRDLRRWEPLPPAIRPDALGHIWSGSAVVDPHDTSGLFGGQPGIACLFTYFSPPDQRQSQGLATSADGRTFRTYPGNPVIPQLRHLPGQPDDKDFRDPKVFWHAPTKRWVMVVAGGKLRVFSSADLIHWRFESVDETITTECPDLFELAVEGDAAARCWVLSGGGRWYMLGRFDGARFQPETERLPMTFGRDAYALQTWDGAPDGRRIGVQWLFAWQYGCGPRAGRIQDAFAARCWSGGCLGVPTELTLRSTDEGPRLVQWPAPEVFRGWRTARACRDVGLEPGGADPLAEDASSAFDLHLDLLPEASAVVALEVPATGRERCVLRYDAAGRTLTLDRCGSTYGHVPGYAEAFAAPMPVVSEGRVRLRVLFDRCSVEVFAADGRVHLAAFILPEAGCGGARLSVSGGACRIANLELRVPANHP